MARFDSGKPSKFMQTVSFVFAILLGILAFGGLAAWVDTAAAQSAQAAKIGSATASNHALSVPVVSATATPVCGLRWRDFDYTLPNTTYGIAALTASDVWVATSGGLTHWDGAQWSFFGPYGTLQDIDALSPSDIWAVGYGNNSSASLIMHWDGASWTTVPSPNPHPSYNALSGVAAIAPDNVWAVGEQTGILHWDGAQWTQVFFPGSNIFLRNIDATSANDIWVVGNENPAPSYTVVLHWNGSGWTRMPSPSPSTNENVFQGVEAISANDVWAVGFQCCPDAGLYHTLIEHWDGTQWTVIPGAEPGTLENILVDIAAASPDQVWAVGSFRDPARPGEALIEQWDGQQWAYVPVDNSPSGAGIFNAVAVLSASDVWAGGRIFRYYDPCATPTSTPTSTSTSVPTGTSTSTSTIAIPTGTSTSTSTIAIPTGTQPPSSTPTLTSTSTASSSPTSTQPPSNTATATPISSTNTPRRSETASPTVQATATLTITPTATPCSLSFTDVQAGDYFYQPVLYLACHGAISGYSDGTFRPYKNTTRGQLSKIVVLAEGWALDMGGGPHFSDVGASNPFYPFIETAYHHGIISGYSDGTFRWGNNITRAQLTKVIVLAKGWAMNPSAQPTFRDVGVGYPFYAYIETAYAHNTISGYSCGGGCLEFRPGSYATRGQIAKIVYGAVLQP